MNGLLNSIKTSLKTLQGISIALFVFILTPSSYQSYEKSIQELDLIKKAYLQDSYSYDTYLHKNEPNLSSKKLQKKIEDICEGKGLVCKYYPNYYQPVLYNIEDGGILFNTKEENTVKSYIELINGNYSIDLLYIEEDSFINKLNDIQYKIPNGYTVLDDLSLVFQYNNSENAEIRIDISNNTTKSKNLKIDDIPYNRKKIEKNYTTFFYEINKLSNEKPTFKEIYKYKEYLFGKNVEDAILYLINKRDDAESKISLLGFEIKAEIVFFLAPVLTLYFFLYLHSGLKTLSNKTSDENYLELTIFHQTGEGRIIMALNLLLPVLANIIFIYFYSAQSNNLVISIAIISWLLSLYFCYGSIIKINAMKKKIQ